MSNTDKAMELPPLSEEDRQFLHYNPNTDDLVEFVETYARKSIASDRAVRYVHCTRSHPHEDMNAMCELRTEIARLTSENARFMADRARLAGQEPFKILGYRYSRNNGMTWHLCEDDPTELMPDTGGIIIPLIAASRVPVAPVDMVLYCPSSFCAVCGWKRGHDIGCPNDPLNP